MKKFIFTVMFSFFLLSNCLTDSNIIKNYFSPINQTAKIAVKFVYYLRTVHTTPDNFFIQNNKTLNIYKLDKSTEDVFFCNNLPLGQYRLGYWTATFTNNETPFRILSFLNFTYNISKPGKYNLGIYKVQHFVDSLIVKKPLVNYTLLNLPQKEYINYQQTPPQKNELKLDKTIFYKRLDGYGVALKLEDEGNKQAENVLLDNIGYLKYNMQMMLQAIDEEFSQKGLRSALNLLEVFNLDSPNINFLIKKAQLYQDNDNNKKGGEIFNRIKAIDPNCAEYYSYIGEKEYNSDNIEEARQILYKAISLNTSFASSYDLYAKILLNKNKDLDVALSLSNKSLEYYPNNIGYLKTNLDLNKKLGNKNTYNKLLKVIEKLKHEKQKNK